MTKCLYLEKQRSRNRELHVIKGNEEIHPSIEDDSNSDRKKCEASLVRLSALSSPEGRENAPSHTAIKLSDWQPEFRLSFGLLLLLNIPVLIVQDRSSLVK